MSNVLTTSNCSDFTKCRDRCNEMSIKRDYYCVDADNRVVLMPIETDVISFSDYFNRAHITIEKAEDGGSILEMSMLSDWEPPRIFSTKFHTNVALTSAQIKSLENAWFICYKMPVTYHPQYFHRLYFSLVIRDPVAREIFSEWISHAKRNRYFIRPDFIAPGPVAFEDLND